MEGKIKQVKAIKNFKFNLWLEEKHFLKMNYDLRSFSMNCETSCIAKGSLNIIVGGMNVLHLIAKVWQNIKKDNRENRARDRLGRRQTVIDQLLRLLLGQETPFSSFIQCKKLQIITKESFYSSFLYFPGDTRVSEE